MKNEFDYLNNVKMDLSIYEDEPISEEEFKMMKKSIEPCRKRNRKKLYVTAACAAACAVITGSVFASGLADNIIKEISTGKNNFIQTDPAAPHTLPEELQGKLFDENGAPLGSISDADADHLYNAEGKLMTREEITAVYKEALGDKVKISVYDGDEDPDEGKTFFDSFEDAQKDATFDIKLPAYLPEGYTVSRIYGFGDSGYYRYFDYTNANGDTIFVFERLLNDETAFEAGTDGTLEELEINGRKAVLMDGSGIDWETEDSVSVGIETNGCISREELIKMAESTK